MAKSEGPSHSWRDGRREWVRYVETISRDWGRAREAKELCHQELRESRALEARCQDAIVGGHSP
jgi:hypothetical protein